MASKYGHVLRNFVKLSPRFAIQGTSRCSYSVLSVIRKEEKNKNIHRNFPTTSQFQQNQRFYGDDADNESLEDKTMNVLKLFDKVNPSKVIF